VRLLVVTQYFWPEDFRVNELVAELVRRGHDVTVLTGLPNYPTGTVFPEFRANPDQYGAYAGARVVRVPILPRGQGALRLALNYASFAVAATLRGYRRLAHERFDAVFVFEPSPITVGIPAIAFRGLKRWPVALWVLDQWPETLVAVGALRSPALVRLVGGLVSFIYDRCDLILGQSRGMVERIRTYCRHPDRVAYFPNWVESVYVDDAPPPAPEVPSAPGMFTVMFAGNIGESQDFPAILDAAQSLKDEPVRWVVVGDGRAAPWVKEELRRRGLEARVSMLGRFPPERMPSLYRRADALLASLKPEPVFAMTIPGKVQSYLASGVPLLAMLDGDGARVIEESGAGFTCRAGDARALAANVRRMVALPAETRARMGANGLAYARREFDRDMLVDRLETMLSDIASRAPAVHA
jgi:colanic acid biosynthesis glycosyl transferase WcaI